MYIILYLTGYYIIFQRVFYIILQNINYLLCISNYNAYTTYEQGNELYY